jgi:5'-methylthioadenosine phosphorylase
MTVPPRIGVIGGSVLYDMEGLEVEEERLLETPFGDPSDSYLLGQLDGAPVAFLARHGRGHRLLPTEINFRANLFGLKLLGVERVVSVSAVGSMKLEYEPCHVVVPDQFLDRTRHRPDTFFGQGLVAHVSLAEPICPELFPLLADAAGAAGATVHRGGTYLCMEGPQFSSRAESLLYRQWGIDVIGMTNLPEAKLAREAEMCYGTLAMVTDYDCWHQGLEAASAGAIMEVIRQNVATAQQVVRRAVGALAGAPPRACACCEALRHALITDPTVIPPSTLEKLGPIVGKYLERH